MKKAPLLSIRGALTGKRVLLTGSTGFVAKAVLEKILRDVPEVAQIYLLVRPRVKADGSRVDPQERLRDEILNSLAFRRLREQLGDQFFDHCYSKLTCISGDLTRPHLGLDDEVFAKISGAADAIIHSAATVKFDERLDLALETNTQAPRRLLELAAAAGAIYVHVSTAYVCGRRSGMVHEKLNPPLEAINAQLAPDLPRPEHFDVLEEVARLTQLAQRLTEDCEKLARAKGLAPESEEAANQLQTALVSAGMKRAHSLGWNDTYTFTKYLGEQVVLSQHGKVPTAIVRPSIIESALEEPEPGWLDGLRMADPLIVGFGKGRLPDFPADQNVVLDIIPVDLVVNGILAVTAHLFGLTGKKAAKTSAHQETAAPCEVFQIASSSEKPLTFRDLYEYVRAYFQRHPLVDRSGKPVQVPRWKFPTVEQYRRHMRNRYLRPIRAATAILDGPVPLPGKRRMRSRLRTLNTTIEKLLNYVDLYGPYVTLNCRFETVRSRQLFEALPPEERKCFNFDPLRIRWRYYIQDVHIPGLKRNILRLEEEPLGAGKPSGAGGKPSPGPDTQVADAGALPASARGAPATIVELCARGRDLYGARTLAEMRPAAPEDGRGPRASGKNAMRLSYTELFEKSGILARRLIARLGLQPGDRVVLSGENRPEWLLAYLAISRAGCTAVPLDRQMSGADAAQLARLVEAKAILMSEAIFKAAEEVFAPGFGLPPCLNFHAEMAPHPGHRWPYPEASIGERALPEPAPEALASILFTSGTTREPKGVMLTHANFISDALATAKVLEPMVSDRFLSVLPLHHALEFTGGFLIPLFGGALIYYLEKISAKDIVTAMKQGRITVVIGVPRLFKLFRDRISAKIAAKGAATRLLVTLGQGAASAVAAASGASAHKWIFKEVHDGLGGHLRLFVSGGAALDPEVFRFFKDFGIPIVEGYGLTETAPILTVNSLNAPRAACVGRPVPGVEISLGQPNGEGIGEVLARGPMIMQGYWRNPAATEKAFENGWFKTGDLGRIEKDGGLCLTGRCKDVIVTGAGKNIYPDEIEWALRNLEGVKELCVLGLPARSGPGEEVAAIIVPESESLRPAIEEAVERVNACLSSHQRVARMEFQADDLPKTSTLKIQRNKLRDRYTHASGVLPVPRKAGISGELAAVAGTLAEMPEAERKLFVEVAKAVADVPEVRTPASELTPAMRLQIDLGIDSIGRVELLGNLEQRFGISISEEKIGKLFTIRDVMAAVEASRAGGKGKAAKPLLERTTSQVDEIRDGLQPTFSQKVLRSVFGTTASVFMNSYLRIECAGLEHVPEKGPFILAANHCSLLDSVAIREALGQRASELHLMGAKDYFFDTRLKSWFFRTFVNALPFDRLENTAEGLAVCKAVLDANRSIVLFPEGTRSITGQLQQFKAGIGVLAVELDVPVIPLYLRGTFKALPKGNSLPRPARIEVLIGPPADFSALKAERGKTPPTELYRRAANELRTRILALSGE